MPDFPPRGRLKAAAIADPPEASAFATDPGRTRELPPSGFAAGRLKAAPIAPPSPASPFGIDPNRTQEMS